MKTRIPAALAVAGAACLLALAPRTLAETAPADTAAPKAKEEGKKLTAAMVVADMQKSVALIAKSAKGKISTKSKPASPFWSALKDSSKAIDKMEAGLKKNDSSTMEGLDSLGVNVHQLAAAWGVLKASHEGVDVAPGLKALTKSYETFLFHFGPSVARKKMGGEVTAAEKTALAAARKEVEGIKSQLTVIEGKAKPKSYQQRFVHDILVLCKDVEAVKGEDLKTYCTYLYQYNRLKYTVLAYNSLVDDWFPNFSKDWNTVAKEKNEKQEGCGAFTETEVTYYKEYHYADKAVAKTEGYFEVVACVEVITETEEATLEEYTESYSEESATEESSEEMADVEEDVSVDEGDSESFADESDGADTDESDDDGCADDADDGGGEDE